MLDCAERRVGATLRGVRMRRISVSWMCGASIVWMSGVCYSNEAETPAVTPYRPSVSTPAQLSAPGWLEAEFGWLRAASDGTDRDSVSYTLKLALTSDWGIRIGGEAVVREVLPAGGSRYTFGDTAFVLKRRLVAGHEGAWGRLTNAAFGLEGGVVAPTARDGIGSSAYTVNSIFSTDIGAWHSDTNVFGTRLTAANPVVGRWQWGWASALSRNITDRWGVVGEVSGSHQANTTDTAQVLFAGSYALSSGSVVDGGLARSLQRASAATQVFAGVTVILGRVR